MYLNQYPNMCGCANNCQGSVTPTNQCGCGCRENEGNMCMNEGWGNPCPHMHVEPIAVPERTVCMHSCHLHEQPVIVPVENRLVRHHSFAPRYYGVARYTTRDVIEDNTINNVNTGIYPNFMNF